MTRAGGRRARLIGLLTGAIVAGMALSPVTAGALSAQVVANQDAGLAASAGGAPLGIAPPPAAEAATAAPTDAASTPRAGLSAFGSIAGAVPTGPLAIRAAPVPRPPVPQTAILEAAPAPPSLTPRPVLAAADGLDVATDATYVVDPVARVVRVAVELTAVNRLPVTPGARYYYPGVNLAVQSEGRQFAADEGGTGDRTTTQARTGYRVLTVQFANRLYVGQTAHLHVSYVLPAGAPRSTSQVRVGAASTTFMAWAFGDRGNVEVDVPPQFSAEASGGPMQQGTASDGHTALTASTSDPGSWYAWIDARDDSALTSRPLALPGGEQVVVRAWPEDPTWETDVAKTLTRAIPALAKRIGLPWPVSGQLSVLEVSGTLLEGYAGFYSPGNQQITISEAVDPFTVVHEASHAWFNASLFTERWLTEGLADEYAFRTLTGLGVAVAGPGKVRANAPVAFALDTWGMPAPIKTRTQDTREQWAYQASWTVVRAVVAKLGEARMATVFGVAKAGTTAYPGASAPEKSRRAGDWRRFVDLAEEVGGGRGIAETIAPWVLTPAERALLAPRATARAAYHDLVAQDADWSAPVVVRIDLDAWDFVAATSAIADATAVLEVRDAIRTEAARERLAVPAALEPAYELATSGDALAAAADEARSLRGSLDAVAGADAALAASRDWLASLGLVGQDPSGALVAARTAWSAGDAATAAAEAAAVLGALGVAADAGRLRLVAIGAGVLALVILAVLAVAVARRRARHARIALAGDAPTGVPAGLAWSAEPTAAFASSAALGPVPLPPGAPPPSPDERIDPSLAPPPAPSGWPPAVLPEPSVPPGPYPILPANAAARPTPRSSADRDDEGAQ